MSHNDVIGRIKSAIATYLPQGGEALLYGSRARGDAQAASDWDVLILLDKPRLENDDYVKVSYPLTLLGCEIGETINPVMYTRDEWHKYAFTPFYKNVQREGIRL